MWNLTRIWSLPEADDRGGYLRIAGLACVGVGGAMYAVWAARSHRQAERFREQRMFLRESRIQMLTTLKQSLMNQEKTLRMELLRLGLAELSAQLRSGRLKAEQVLQVYQAQALRAHEATNCLTSCVSEALPQAQELDRLQGPKGPLHGIPVSLKDNLFLAGYVNSHGLSKMCDNVPQEDCILVQVLRSQGAVPFVQTGFPQLFMSFESSNPIFGAVRNPHDLLRNPGGSSGGEAALIASGGSILGFGTDIGGSIRAPCAFCGICGLKTTWERLGYPNPPRQQNLLLPAAGPMARDVESLAIAMRAVLVPELFARDPRVPPIPFRDDVYHSTSSLTIGYYVDDNYCPASPANARAVMEAKRALEAAGHRLVPWTPPEIQFTMRASGRCFGGDHGKLVCNALDNDVVDSCVMPFYYLVSLSRISRWFQVLYQRYVRRKPKLAQYIASFRGQDSVSEWWNWTLEVELYRQRYFAAWRASGLDAVLCPTFTFPALKLGSAFQYLRNSNYLKLYNLLNMPAGVMPVTQVTAEDVEGLKEWSHHCEDGAYVSEDQLQAHGMPVGVQVAATRWNEEVVLRVMRDIESRVGYASHYTS